MPSLTAIELFARVADRGSFTRAADELHLSRTRASRLVRELEAELGVELLTRTTRAVALTEAGTAYLDRVRVALDALRAASDDAAELGARPKGRLRVSAPLSFGLLHLAPVVAGFRDAFPEVTVDLQLTDRRVDVIEEGFDVALRIGDLADSSLRARRLAPIERVLAAAPAYLDRRGAPAAPDDLARHDCLAFSLMAERTDWLLAGPGRRTARVAVSGGVAANNGDLLAALAERGGGIVNMPVFIVAARLDAGRLVRVLPDWAPPPTALHALWPGARPPPPKLRGFLDVLAAAFAGPAPWDRAAARSGEEPAAKAT
jgi:DNA-binding transcriptional LysR family regulator